MELNRFGIISIRKSRRQHSYNSNEKRRETFLLNLSSSDMQYLLPPVHCTNPRHTYGSMGP